MMKKKIEMVDNTGKCRLNQGNLIKALHLTGQELGARVK